MNGTPRLRSAYPATPDAAKKGGRQDVSSPTSPLPSMPADQPNDDADASAPLIPFETLDAPTQRFYVFAFWGCLLAWRFYDFYLLLLDENESLWLFMKWVAIDAAFLYGVPALRIPWLEWSTFACTILFVLHATCNLMLMFRIMVWVRRDQYRALLTSFSRHSRHL
jgi:nucleoporin POM152